MGEASSPLVVLIVATPPVPRFISPLGSAVEPLPHAPKGIQSASICRIGVVDHTLLENEGAHARPFAHERGAIDSGSPYVLVRGARRLQRVLAMIVVFDAARPLLLLSETDAVVEVEISAERRRPRETTSSGASIAPKRGRIPLSLRSLIFSCPLSDEHLPSGIACASHFQIAPEKFPESSPSLAYGLSLHQCPEDRNARGSSGCPLPVS